MSDVVYTDVRSFGRALLQARDLDPIYEMLYQSRLKERELKRWLVAYWLFYHAGVASWITEKPNFWKTVDYAYLNNLPRGAERRHMRGAVPFANISTIRVDYPTPEELVDFLTEGKTFTEVSKRVRSLPQFGAWIAFKVADMMERVLGVDIDFSDCDLEFYEQPALAGAFVYEDEGVAAKLEALNIKPFRGWTPERRKREHRVAATVCWMQHEFQDVKAPPDLRRMVGVQEIETILCKYKSHRKGSYPIGKDRREIIHGLDNWGDLAMELKEGLV